MIIHQIFLKVSEKNLEDFPCYIEGIKMWKQWCLDNGYEYKLWTEIPYELLDDYDKDMLKDCVDRFTFSAIDFIRMPILENYGGMYVDLDVYPTDKLINIMDRENIFGTGYTDKKTFITNNVMKCSKENARKMRMYSRECYEEKKQMKIYDTWVKRFFLRTTGASMVCNFCKKYLKYEMIPKDKFIECFTDHMTKVWSALEKQLKNITPVITNMSELKIDDCVKMKGGKCKGAEGVVINIMKLFASVRLTKDKKGNPVFSDKPNKVKREHIEVIPPTPLEMPSTDDLKVVDDLEPTKNLIDEIDAKLISESKSENIKTIVEEQPKLNATLVDEHGCSSELPTIDDAINLRDENQRLKLQIESLVSWQTHASAECAKHRKDYMDLKKKYDEEAVKYRKEELIALINKM